MRQVEGALSELVPPCLISGMGQLTEDSFRDLQRSSWPGFRLSRERYRSSSSKSLTTLVMVLDLGLVEEGVDLALLSDETAETAGTDCSTRV